MTMMPPQTTFLTRLTRNATLVGYLITHPKIKNRGVSSYYPNVVINNDKSKNKEFKKGNMVSTGVSNGLKGIVFMDSPTR